MKQFMLPIVLAAIAAFIVIIGGLAGGVGFVSILKRLILFTLIIGGLGFALNFLLAKWGVELNPDNSTSNQDKHTGSSEQNSESDNLKQDNDAAGKNDDDKPFEPSKNKEKIAINEKSKDDSLFDYTVKDDEEIEFKPLDETIVQKESKQYLEVDGEKIEYDPKKAAGVIKQLLSENKSDE